ncbi:MAG: hypothetical protein IJA07_08055 [Agathobacter sp.]|nr:hypothetical protein [Agathobacter sp.]
MKKYIFKNGVKIENDYKYIFLCGSKYSTPKNKRKIDKRIILKKFLQGYNENNIPIILEENFIFQRNKRKQLCYDDIFMSNLYQVELLTSFLVDNVIIIQESISTGAEAGLFLSSKNLWKKICLLVPDEIAVEEDKVGGFLSLAFLKESELKKMLFYPQVEPNIVSENLRYWHTYFFNDQIGTYLGKQIIEFLGDAEQSSEIKFSRKDRLEEGYIKYKIGNSELVITANVKSLMLCISAIFSVKEFQEEFFSSTPHELNGYISILKKWLMQIFINTIEEFTGANISSCKIIPNINIKDVYTTQVIGMILYLFQAAGFIEIKKTTDYEADKQVLIVRKMTVIKNEEKEKNEENEKSEEKRFFFYKKYSDCICEQVEPQIV